MLGLMAFDRLSSGDWMESELALFRSSVGRSSGSTPLAASCPVIWTEAASLDFGWGRRSAALGDSR
jgi:hypothetical protein